MLDQQGDLMQPLPLLPSPSGVTDGAGVQPEGAGAGRTAAGAGGMQPKLQCRSDAAPHSTAEKYPALEGRGQDPDSVLRD